MKILFTSCIVAFLLLNACTEKTRVNIVSGTLFLDCDNTLGGVEVALKANEGQSFNNQLILGSAIVGSDGFYNFTYELEEEDMGTGDLILVKSTGFDNLLQGVTLNTDISMNLYVNNIATLAITLTGNKVFSINDTLYYAIDGDTMDSFSVQPSNGVLDTLRTNLLNSNQTSVSTKLYYGVGLAELQRAKGDTSFNNIDLTLNGCGNINTTEIQVD